MQVQVDALNNVLIFAIIALSLNLLLGHGGQFSAAQSAFAGLGGYVAASLAVHAHWPLLAALALGLVTSAAFGCVIGLPSSLLAPEYVMLFTLSIGLIFTDAVSNFSFTGGIYGLLGVPQPILFGIQLSSPERWFVVLFVLTAVVYIVTRQIVRSAFGRVLRAIRDDEFAARSLGKHVFASKLLVFSVSAGIAGLGGALLAYYSNVATPAQFSFAQMIEFFAIIIIGGLGSLPGTLAGSVIVIELPLILSNYVHVSTTNAGLISQIAFGIILVLIIWLRPQGLLGRSSLPSWQSPMRVFRLWLPGRGPETVTTRAMGPATPSTENSRRP